MPRLPTTDIPPKGLLYEPEALPIQESDRLQRTLADLRFDRIVIRGQEAKRRARHYGLNYDYEARGHLTEGEPIPGWLRPVRAAAARLAEVAPEQLVEALVQRYPPGSSIGWHRDAPMFDLVVGLSVVAPCRMRFRRTAGGDPVVYERLLEPRSGYVLAGSVRWAWQHSIPPGPELRYSITFRTLGPKG